MTIRSIMLRTAELGVYLGLIRWLGPVWVSSDTTAGTVIALGLGSLVLSLHVLFRTALIVEMINRDALTHNSGLYWTLILAFGLFGLSIWFGVLISGKV